MTYLMVDQVNNAAFEARTMSLDCARSTRRFSDVAETVLPLAAVAIGIALILGPFLATVVRSALYWDASGPALSWRTFSGLFADPHFYQAAADTVTFGLGATVLSCV